MEQRKTRYAKSEDEEQKAHKDSQTAEKNAAAEDFCGVPQFPCSAPCSKNCCEENGKIGALVYCGENVPGAAEKVQAYVTELNRTLPLYKRISAVHLSDGPLPRNAAGKLLRS